MTKEAFAAQVEALIAQGRDGGLSDEAILAVLCEAVEALEEGLT